MSSSLITSRVGGCAGGGFGGGRSGSAGRNREPGRGACPGRARRSELELVDVAGVEGERVAEKDGLVGADGEVAERPRGELVTLLARDGALDEGVRGIRGEG